MSDRGAVVGNTCGWCGEPMTDPVTVDEGTMMEDYACRGECAEHCTYEEVVDYDRLVDSLFSHDRVISWW